MLGIDLDKADHGPHEDLAIVATLATRGLSQLVLRTDVGGMPLEWIDYKEAARLYHQSQVAYTCGSPLYELYGGTNALTEWRPACFFDPQRRTAPVFRNAPGHQHRHL